MGSCSAKENCWNTDKRSSPDEDMGTWFGEFKTALPPPSAAMARYPPGERAAACDAWRHRCRGGVVRVHEAKFHKSRLVTLSPGDRRELRAYLRARSAGCGDVRPGAPLLCNCSATARGAGDPTPGRGFATAPRGCSSRPAWGTGKAGDGVSTTFARGSPSMRSPGSTSAARMSRAACRISPSTWGTSRLHGPLPALRADARSAGQPTLRAPQCGDLIEDVADEQP